MDALPDILTAHSPFHAATAIAGAWQPIASYRKHEPTIVLLRGAGQAVLGIWGMGYARAGERPLMMWRSVEESTLDSPLWFEPTYFATLSDDDEQFYLRR